MKRQTSFLFLRSLCVGFCGRVGATETSVPTPSPAPTLPPHYPTQRPPLPEGGTVYDFDTIAAGEKQADDVVLTLPIKKAET